MTINAFFIEQVHMISIRNYLSRLVNDLAPLLVRVLQHQNVMDTKRESLSLQKHREQLGQRCQQLRRTCSTVQLVHRVNQTVRSCTVMRFVQNSNDQLTATENHLGLGQLQIVQWTPAGGPGAWLPNLPLFGADFRRRFEVDRSHIGGRQINDDGRENLLARPQTNGLYDGGRQEFDVPANMTESGENELLIVLSIEETTSHRDLHTRDHVILDQTAEWSSVFRHQVLIGHIY